MRLNMHYAIFIMHDRTSLRYIRFITIWIRFDRGAYSILFRLCWYLNLLTDRILESCIDLRRGRWAFWQCEFAEPRIESRGRNWKSINYGIFRRRGSFEACAKSDRSFLIVHRCVLLGSFASAKVTTVLVYCIRKDDDDALNSAATSFFSFAQIMNTI